MHGCRQFLAPLRIVHGKWGICLSDCPVDDAILEATMARPIWTGVISFGLVSVPVSIYSATESHEVSFHQFQEGTSDRIRYKRINERTGREVEYDDIVKGAEVGDDKYVLVDPDELDSIAPGRSRSLEIVTFVDQDEIDPIYYQKSYYLAPANKESAKTYALLRQAMLASNKVAIGRFVMRGKEHLTAIRPETKVLILETMFFADEVRNPREALSTLPRDATFRGQELKMAKQLITSMTGTWNPKDYHDTYTDRVKKLIAAKRKGREVVTEAEPPEATNVTDLMEVLRRSVDDAKSGRGQRASRTTKKSTVRTTKKSTAKKSTAKKAVKKTTAKKKARSPARKAS
jgi:DNA end-binding protein Ku